VGTDSVAVVISGSVDTTTAGTYTIKYNATDSAGNKAAEVTRTVIIGDGVQAPSPSGKAGDEVDASGNSQSEVGSSTDSTTTDTSTQTTTTDTQAAPADSTPAAQ
jgi:hypothetical protein